MTQYDPSIGQQNPCIGPCFGSKIVKKTKTKRMGDIFKPIEAVLVRATHFLCTLVLGMGEHADVAMRSQDMFGCGQREKLLLTQHL